MYAKLSNRGTNKIVASTRRGPAKQFDNLESKDIETRDSNFVMNSPRPVFNGRHAALHRGQYGSQEVAIVNPQHEEIVKFVHDTWIKVSNEVERNQREGGPQRYREKKQTPLANFKPFDLAEYWGKRTMQKLKISGST